jgi:hypothetical protein
MSNTPVTTPQAPPPPRGEPSRLWLAALCMLLGAGAAWAVGNLMGTKTLAIALGLAVGVIASVPLTIVLLAVARRNTAAEMARTQALQAPPDAWRAPAPQPQPQIVMLNLADFIRQQALQPQPPPTLDAAWQPGAPRVVGTEGDEWL